MFWLFAIITSSLQLCAATSPSSKRGEMVKKHSWVKIPRGWEYESHAPANFTFTIRMALKSKGIDDLIAILMETSDPKNPKYGHHLSSNEAEALVSPRQESVQTVEDWIKDHEILPETIVRQSGGGVWFTFPISVARAERMLDTQYNIYRHSITSERVVRAMNYSLPRELHDHIDVVTPTTYFSTRLSSARTRRIYSNDDVHLAATSNRTTPVQPCFSEGGITPARLKELYKTADYIPTATGTNKLGVTGYWNFYANLVDLQLFFKKYLPMAPAPNYTTVEVNGGGNNQSNPFFEPDFDIQYTMALADPTPNIFYSVGGEGPSIDSSHHDTVEPYLNWLLYLFRSGDIPQTITTSYSEEEQLVPKDYAMKVCQMFAHLGVMGTTLFFSSGDVGVGLITPRENDCITLDGSGRVQFQPHFPPSCPYITAVGGTTGINPEVAWQFSGGGFSRYFKTPWYQLVDVSRYVRNLGTTYQGLYNEVGRAYPDLSAQSDNFQYIFKENPMCFSGTSASTPTVAGIFTLLNDFRIANRKPSLGFINPLIYSLAMDAFNDIVSGSNPGCNTTGFNSTKGWDPVTGLGTPDFLKLKKLMATL